MGRFGIRIAYLSLTAVAAAGSSDGVGQNRGEGVVNAVAYRSIPALEPLYVRILDDSEPNLAIKKRFEAELKSRGYVLTENPSGLVLTIETERQTAAWSAPPAVVDTPLIDQEGRLSLTKRAELPRLAGAPRRQGTDIITPSRYRLDVTIDDRTDTTRFWEGWAVADLSEEDPPDLSKIMVPALVGSIGRTVRQQPFVIGESGSGGPP